MQTMKYKIMNATYLCKFHPYSDKLHVVSLYKTRVPTNTINMPVHVYVMISA